MKNKMNTLFDYIRTVCDSDLDRILNFAKGILSANQNLSARPKCPYCQSSKIIKYGHA